MSAMSGAGKSPSMPAGRAAALFSYVVHGVKRSAFASAAPSSRYSVKCPTGDTSTSWPKSAVAPATKRFLTIETMPEWLSRSLPVFALMQKMKASIIATAAHERSAHARRERRGRFEPSRSSLVVAFDSSMVCELLRVGVPAFLFVMRDCVFMVCDSIKSVGYGRNGQGFRYH